MQTWVVLNLFKQAVSLPAKEIPDAAFSLAPWPQPRLWVPLKAVSKLGRLGGLAGSGCAGEGAGVMPRLSMVRRKARRAAAPGPGSSLAPG